MGHGNVMLVSANWGRLPGNAFKVLVRMALVCLDSDTSPCWWGGDGPLLQALGRTVPDQGDTSDEAETARHANGVALRAAVNDLARAGALRYKVRPSRSRQAEYWLHFQPQGNPAVRAGKPCSSDRETLQFAQGNPAVPATKLQVTPQKPRSEEDVRGPTNTTGTTSPLVSTSPAPVDESQCPRCRWAAWEGHHPDCPAATDTRRSA
jgi:hypothetical protein